MAGKGRILIVDDDPDFVKTTQMILSSDGYDIVTASDSKQGLSKVQECQPDLILLDIMMESLFEGFSFLGTIKTDPQFETFNSIPVVMVSSVKTDTGSRFHFEEDSSVGDIPKPDDYMDKPLRAKELLEKVGQLIGRKR